MSILNACQTKMEEVQYVIKESISPFVNCIMASESKLEDGVFKLPLYADGYPGIMFQQSENGFYLLPKNKKLSELFLYGQTLDPISLETKGAYKFVVFQLYPFASKYLLNVDPKKLNDECYDLLQINNIKIHDYYRDLLTKDDLSAQIEIIFEVIEKLIQQYQVPHDDRIQQAIKLIIESYGRIKIKDIGEKVALTKRTLERNFQTKIGLSPKQFAKIIQFQTSLNKLTQDHYDKLTHIGLDSGFNDQSHFIRVFKEYTGQTPSYYLKQFQSTY